MPDAVIQNLHADLQRVRAARSRQLEAGATEVSAADRSARLIALASLDREENRILRRIRQRRLTLAGVDPVFGGSVEFKTPSEIDEDSGS